MRRDELYLHDIVEAADCIAEFIAGVELDDFQASEMLRSAVVQKLLVIGEAAARISEATRISHAEVPWAQIVGFRNILVHAYFGIEWEVVWRVAKNRCPELREAVAGMVAAEEGEQDGTSQGDGN